MNRPEVIYKPSGYRNKALTSMNRYVWMTNRRIRRRAILSQAYESLDRMDFCVEKMMMFCVSDNK